MHWRVYIVLVVCCLSTLCEGQQGNGVLVQTNVSWAGALAPWYCNCSDYQTNGTGVPYACTGEQSGDWSGGIKYFHDNEVDPSYALTQVIVNIYGSFDCDSDQDLSVMLNEEPVGTVTIPINSKDYCSKCKNCYADTAPITLASDIYVNGFPFYNTGVPNFISLSLHNNDAKFCISHVSLLLIYNQTLQVQDSSSSQSWDLDAPPWFWTLVGAAGVIVLVLVLTLFILWRRSRTSSASFGGYRPLNSTEYLDPRQLDDISIEIKEFTMDKEIGHGSFGVVHKALWRGTEVAVKRLPRESIAENDILLEFMKEAFIMRQLRHPNVLQVLGVCLEPPCIVMEYMPRGSLFHIIHNAPLVSLNWPVVRKLAVEICRGMAYLHGCSPPLIHRDLKPHNLLVDDMWRVKVCDFGLSRFWEAKKDMTACGTPAYAAPEVLRNAAYSVSADVYSFGIVLWELTSRQPLYPGMPPFQIIFAVGTQGTRPTIPPTCAPQISQLIQDCWAEDPAARPSFVELAERIAGMPEEL